MATMKDLLMRILVLIAASSIVLSPMSSARAQQYNPAHLQTAGSQKPSQTRTESASAGEVQTQESLAFTGRVVKVQTQFVLHDPTTKVSYQLDDQSKAKRYVGKQVKVIGRLEMNSNTIRIDSIEPLS
jgi:uncharacterized protein YdeI (BOF family)